MLPAGPAWAAERRRARLTQAELARRSGVSIWAVRRLETAGGSVGKATRRFVSAAIKLELDLAAMHDDEGGSQ